MMSVIEPGAGRQWTATFLERSAARLKRQPAKLEHDYAACIERLRA